MTAAKHAIVLRPTVGWIQSACYVVMEVPSGKTCSTFDSHRMAQSASRRVDSVIPRVPVCRFAPLAGQPLILVRLGVSIADIEEGTALKFDIYGRFELEVLRENNAWAVYRLGVGTRSRANDVVLPAELAPDELATFLDDLFHELDRENKGVREV